MMGIHRLLTALTALFLIACTAFAQKYNGVIDKTIAVVGNEMISLSEIEEQVQMAKTQGLGSDKNIRCELLETMMQDKLFLMQARIDSLTVNNDMVEATLSERFDNVRTVFGGDEAVADYFGKPLYKLRQEWRKQLEDQSLAQQEQMEIAKKIPEITPYDVKQYIDTVDVSYLPIIPVKYKMSQICEYPDREAAALAVKERLLSIRERIMNGEKFSTLARLYSEDPGTSRKGGELGMASKNIFWPAFSDAAMALKPGVISQIVETPDGYHLIEVLAKKGDMFNARHILLKPVYTSDDREKAFKHLDSLKTAIDSAKISFELAARFYSQDPASRTNGGQMSDPNTGSAYFEIDQIKPSDYAAVSSLEVGQISDPIESLDNEGVDRGRSGNLVYKIVRLDKVIPSHPATLEKDYTTLHETVKNIKQKEAVDNFVSGRIGTTYVRIDPIFKDCDFSRSEWASKVITE